MNWNTSWIKPAVRFLVGLPLAVSYFYVRHFELSAAYGLLTVGLTIMISGLATGISKRRRKAFYDGEKSPVAKHKFIPFPWSASGAR